MSGDHAEHTGKGVRVMRRRERRWMKRRIKTGMRF
jgi:hypothetical protein